MALDFALRNWAMLAGSALATAIALFVAYRAFEDSARGQLQRAVRLLNKRRFAVQGAQRAADKAASRLGTLRSKADSVKPRHGQEASGAFEDARAMLKIAQDQEMIAANHVRKIILEEFPPKHHARLRARHLPESEPDKKPFTF